MWKFLLAVVLAAGTVTTVEASSTTIAAAPTSSVAGQTVTFTATFASSCPGAVTSHWFTIDGQGVNGVFTQTGQAGTESLTISTLAAGSHPISYYWKIKGTICQGLAEMSYTVSPQPSPSPSPSPSTSPVRSPAPSASPSPVALVASAGSDSPLVGYVGGLLIVFVVVAGAALLVLSRR